MSECKKPKCKFRKEVDGVDMCFAIGCCHIGDMPCECEWCKADCEKRKAVKE